MIKEKRNDYFRNFILLLEKGQKFLTFILYADTKNIGGAAEGEMILQLPEIEETAEKMIEYLRETNMGVEELSSDVG